MCTYHDNTFYYALDQSTAGNTAVTLHLGRRVALDRSTPGYCFVLFSFDMFFSLLSRHFFNVSTTAQTLRRLTDTNPHHRADATIAQQATGAMSWAFITALKKNPQQSYVQLLNSIRDELATRYTQKPQLSCSHPLSKPPFSFPIFRRPATPELTRLTCSRYEPPVHHVDTQPMTFCIKDTGPISYTWGLLSRL